MIRFKRFIAESKQSHTTHTLADESILSSEKSQNADRKNLSTELLNHYDHATDEHKRSLRAYTTSDSEGINAILRKRKYPYENQEEKTTMSQHADKIHDYIDKAKPLHRELHVYSYGGRHKAIDNTNQNGVYHTKGIVSTATHIPFDYHGEYNDGRRGSNHFSHFVLPKGYKKGAYIGKNTSFGIDGGRGGHEDEKEYILAHNQKWKYQGSRVIKHPRFPKGDDYTIHTYTPHEEDK